jgi:FkbM family methyltransferase
MTMFNFIFDIGANRGGFTRGHLNQNPNLCGILVEANPNLIYCLENSFKPPRFHILNNLVGMTNDESVNFHLCTDDGLSTASNDWINKSRFSGKNIWNKTIKIKTITIDKIVEIYGIPDFIKIDVEGYELNVIKGIHKYYCPLSFEWTEEEYEKTNMVVNYLENIGYNNFPTL